MVTVLDFAPLPPTDSKPELLKTVLAPVISTVLLEAVALLPTVSVVPPNHVALLTTKLLPVAPAPPPSTTAPALLTMPPLFSKKLLPIAPAVAPIVSAPRLLTTPPLMVTMFPVAALVPTVSPALPLFQTVSARIVSTLLDEPAPTWLAPVVLKI